MYSLPALCGVFGKVQILGEEPVGIFADASPAKSASPASGKSLEKVAVSVVPLLAFEPIDSMQSI